MEQTNPTEKKAQQETIYELINNAHSILVTYFSATDGDSLGAMLAIAALLKKLGKNVTTYIPNDIPETLGFLPGIDQISQNLDKKGSLVITMKCTDRQMESIKYSIEGDKVHVYITPKEGMDITPESINFSNKTNQEFDLIISVDSGDKKQMKENYEKYKKIFDETPLINIDHHESNTLYGTVNYVDKTAASTTQMLLELFQNWDKTKDLIDADIATFFLTGLIWDTGSFKHSNTTTEALDTAAELVALGARQQDIVRHLFKTKKMSQLKLWGNILSRSQYDKENRLLWSYANKDDFDSTGSTDDDTGDIIDELLSNASNTDFVMLFKEKPDGSIRVSIRSSADEKDCTKIAGAFGGGGHIRASGCGFKDITMQEAIDKVLEKAREFQRGA